MSQQQPKFHPWFHNFLIWFALFAFALVAVIYGVRNILSALENGVEYQALVVILSALYIALGLFLVKARFDLAAFRPQAPVELLGACIAAAVITLLLCWITDLSGEEVGRANLLSAVIFVCWGIALYRYYHDRPYLFNGPADQK